MALKDRFRRAVLAARRDSLSTTSSSPKSTPPSSGYTSPVLSRTPSTVQLATLTHAATTVQKSSDKDLKLTKSSSSTSGFSRLSRFVSNKSEFERHAPKNFKFKPADPAKVAMLDSWDWSYGSTRGSISGGVCPLKP